MINNFFFISGIISSLQIALLMIVSLVFVFHALYFPQMSGDPQLLAHI